MPCSRDMTLLADPGLLEKVDSLRDFNVGQHVALPQLVVVGDQSSGKSSLLESLSGIPFPKGQNLCTRHATQITSRRSKDDIVKIRIIPGPDATEDHKKRVEAFSSKPLSCSVFRAQFVDILKKASDKMGLRENLSANYGAAFSEDVLKIEVNGPNEDYLTIIDIPGIFRTTTNGTTEQDMGMVKKMIERYIKDDRTIILAVLPSNVDVATQEILQLAESYDKNGQRTLGVLTKPDLVLGHSEQSAVCDLVQGSRRPLNLGYYLVRNRGEGENSMNQSQLEEIFKSNPWVQLPSERLGIVALKEQLRVLLTEITRQEFPKLIQEVRNKLRICNKSLNNLGPSRQNEHEQRMFLSQIAGNFQKHVRAALSGDYSADASFDEDDKLRLITNIANLTEVFRDDLRYRGHSRSFESTDGVELLSIGDDESDGSDSEDDSFIVPPNSARGLVAMAKLDDLEPHESMELTEIIVAPKQIALPQSKLTQWINDIYLRSKRLDLGTFNPNLITMTLAEQSQKWRYITMLYISRAVVTVHRFISAVLRRVCHEKQAFGQLWAAILDMLLECYKKATDQATLLINVEKHRSPYTLNQQFTQHFLKAQNHRLAELLRAKARKDNKQYKETQLVVSLDDISQVNWDKSNEEQLKEQIHDIVNAYYSIATDRFIDNILQLSVSYQLLTGPESPLNVFTQDWVISLEPRDLEGIAGESKFEKKKRSDLSKKIHDLTLALDILKSR